MIWLNIGLSWKITKVRITPLFSKVDLCSVTSMESSRRDLLNDVAEHKSVLKNNQNTPYLEGVLCVECVETKLQWNS